MRLKFLSCIAVMVLASFTACQDSDDVGENYTTFTGETIGDFVENNAEYSDFAEALRVAGAFSLLESYGAYTCFVPDNEAMEAYASEQGYGTFDNFLDSVEAVKEMVFYHLIDGEANGVPYYETAGFESGAIETKNMLGRYLYTSIASDGASWMVNNTARIVSGDHIKVNGVVHVVDKALAGNTDLVADYIESEGHFKLYGEALHATGLRDALTLLDDETYVPATSKPADDPYSGSANFPKTKNYRYTALLETDSVLALNGIRSLEDMRAYARTYFPEGKDLPDTDERSSLYRFVAYHLLPVMLTSNQIVNTRDYVMTHTWIDADWLRENYRDGSFWLEQYLVPMADQTIITVQAFKWGDQDAQKPVFNDERNCYDAKYTNMAEEEDDVVTLDLAHSNLDCQNGVIHALTDMLVYDEDKIGRIMRGKRIRMDFTIFTPELRNNDVISNKDYYVPQGYCKNFKFEESSTIFAKYIGSNMHSFFLGDYLEIWGMFDASITVGPVPAGSYEVRIGYRVDAATRGITQFYLDDEPCGIPIDMRLKGTDASIGWEQVWQFTQDNSGAWWDEGSREDDPYGYENDKSMHNRGFMKGPDSFCSRELMMGQSGGIKGSTRNDPFEMRKVLGIFSWPETSTHEFRFVQMLNGNCHLDYIEFMPTNLIESEDTH
ncbi:fasciclin domain-containing protein [Paraprevotella xylaniphila]|uniref:fasciclin domain-containing protein n=1 Tax=Paraprevotella xylaniphila TaxID=454155 RepID=UPI001032FDB4|nr:fasciclin domain-containing protein [Paraprevotella xylaniphila]